MADTTYIFQTSTYDADRLLPQVSKALEARTELLSRERCPGMWCATDRVNAMVRGRRRSRLRTRIMGILCLVLGLFLLIPGLMEPKGPSVVLITGAVATAAGIGGLWRSRAHRETPFDRAAKKLLSTVGRPSAGPGAEVTFSEGEMQIAAENADPICVPYDEIECVIEAPDLFLLVYGDRVSVLQRCDLTSGTADAFCQYLEEKVARYRRIGAN